MELGLSLGNRPGLETTSRNSNNLGVINCMGLGLNSSQPSKLGQDQHQQHQDQDQDQDQDDHHDNQEKMGSSSDPSLQLHLLPRRTQPPPLRFPWLPLPPDTLSSEPGSSDGPGSRVVDVNRRGGQAAEEVEEQSSPNSGTSSFMEFSLYTSNNGKGKRNNEENNNRNNYHGQEVEGGGGGGSTGNNSRGSDDIDDENGCNSSTRKKLRLSKEQSAFLEDNFKEHHTLNPKQKQELAKQLNLRPRQVEVWFQNRRARTKLKQTEVDCEYLKRCCETLTEENRRLQKELQELRALKTSQPFFMHLPATTLTMCPSCERVAPTTSSAPAIGAPATTSAVIDSNITLSLGKPKSKTMLPFSQAQVHQAPS